MLLCCVACFVFVSSQVLFWLCVCVCVYVCFSLWQTLIALWMEEGLSQGLRVGVYVEFGSLGRMITDF